MEAALEIVFVVVAAVVVFAVFAAALGRGDGLEEPLTDLARPYLPDGRLVPADIDGVHFAVAFRGYRMDQVDTVLDRLSEEIVARDQRIAALERIVHVQTVQSAANHGAGAKPRLRRNAGAEPYPHPPAQESPTPPAHPSPPAEPSESAAGASDAGTAEWTPADEADTSEGRPPT